MYAVIRAGGKQYRVAPGDVVRVESQSDAKGEIEFADVLAVSSAEGEITRPQSAALVKGEVVEQGRGRKVLVFHYKRKKQYKKIAGHRQPFTAVRITEIAFDGQKFTAAEPAKKAAKPAKKAAAPVSDETKAEGEAAKPVAKKKASPKKKAAAKKATPAKKK